MKCKIKIKEIWYQTSILNNLKWNDRGIRHGLQIINVLKDKYSLTKIMILYYNKIFIE